MLALVALSAGGGRRVAVLGIVAGSHADFTSPLLDENPSPSCQSLYLGASFGEVARLITEEVFFIVDPGCLENAFL